MRLKFLCVCASTLLVAACGTTEPSPNNGDNSASCTTGKCDSAGDWIETVLAGREDPIANWLRTQTELDETNGLLTSTYQEMQFGVAEAQGCDPGTATNYIISDALISNRPFPRLVGTVCTGDESKNWQAFFSPPDANADETDLDVHTVEMFAWDAAAKQYRFYRTEPLEEGDDLLEMRVEPEECAGCHLVHRGLDATQMPMTPIMNELTQPWEHWNAAPGFTSQEFIVDDAVRAAPNYTQLTSGSWAGSARELEIIIRNGHSQVASARVGLRRAQPPASVSTAMSLLRPLFCDEQVNYISENGTSGQLLLDAVVDSGLADLVKKKEATGWGQKWLDPEARLRMSSAGTDDYITMMPVRGSAVTAYEDQLTSVSRGLSVEDVMQVRLIDWQTPVFSNTRCGLWVTANNRLQREQLEGVNISEMRNYELLPILLREVMQVDGVSLMTEQDDQYYLLGDGASLGALTDAIANDAVAQASCEAGSCACDGGACVANLVTMVDVIEENLTSLEADAEARARMYELRQERACIASACYENKPFIPNLDPNCSEACPLGAPL